MPFWCVAQSQPLRERLAQEELIEAGFDVYYPRIQFRQNGRARISGLFPSYLFISINDRWWSARWCRGVIRLLGPDGAPPARVHESVIGEIRKREKNGFVVLKPTPSKIQLGQRCQIIGGRFDGKIALFQGQSSRERIFVLLEILGQQARVELGQNDRIEPLDIARA